MEGFTNLAYTPSIDGASPSFSATNARRVPSSFLSFQVRAGRLTQLGITLSPGSVRPKGRPADVALLMYGPKKTAGQTRDWLHTSPRPAHARAANERGRHTTPTRGSLSHSNRVSLSHQRKRPPSIGHRSQGFLSSRGFLSRWRDLRARGAA